MQPFDIEKGAGTYSPHTFLRALGPEPWKVAYVEPSRRPTDGRYGDNPNRLYRHHQYQVLLKPSPKDTQALYLESMAALGIHPREHDIRFVEDNWESPTLGAWGLGWEVWVDGMELTQFTYFQQCGGHECRPVAAELTYGLERISMYLQGVDNVYDLEYAPGVKYREVFHQDEFEYSSFTFKELQPAMYSRVYDANEKETERLVQKGLVIPAYDHLLKAAHAFNSLDARGAISVTERQGYILRIRDLAKMCADRYLALRDELGFPLLKSKAGQAVLTGLKESRQAPKGVEIKLDETPKYGELFVELGTEELPAFEVEPALTQLKTKLLEGLTELGLDFGPVHAHATPRRLVVVVEDLADRQEDRRIEVAGPPVKAAFKDGQPTKAAEGFAKSQGVEVADLVRRETPKGEYLYAIRDVKGEAVRRLLPKLVEDALGAISFKRSMRWGTVDTPFARPVQWLVVVYDKKRVPLVFADVVSGKQSRGHRFMSPESFEVRNYTGYRVELARRHVVIDAEERRSIILNGARDIARRVGGQLLEDPKLIEELTMLVEKPVLHLNSFDPAFLRIPDEVLMSEMMHHQRYLPILDKEGRLMPKFVVVANTVVQDDSLALDGYRRVLSARFEDGVFFFEEDQKTPLFDRVEKLKTVRFHHALGSIFDKTERIARLAFLVDGGILGRGRLGEAPSDPYDYAQGDLPAEERDLAAWMLARAAFLTKADLNSLMVFEFPELQGVIGSHYARASGELEPIAKAIAEHYLPKGAGDSLPEESLGAILGVADRLDTVAGIFAAGKPPKGGADPFGLRRATIGIVSILWDRGWHISLSRMLSDAIDTLGNLSKRPKDELLADLTAFFRTRIKGLLTQEGISTELAEAVLIAGYDDVVDVRSRAVALTKLREGRDFGPVAEVFKRVRNILKGQEGLVRPPLEALSEEADRRLWQLIEETEAKVKTAERKRDFDAAFAVIGELQPEVARYFDEVRVMAEDLGLRAQRMGLLASLEAIFTGLADLSLVS